ncbi:MAG: cytochrome c oxidase subunit II [Bryobacteraceae bacterium]|nr:cytochrome c oxidase subunit II [Bryobacteraceae bacterium]
MNELPLFPPQASTMSAEVDNLFFYITAVAAFFTVAIYICLGVFAVLYRRRDPRFVPRPILGSTILETTWSVVPLGLAMVMFGWGAKLYYDQYTPPENAHEIFVIGKQWMWKTQHPSGQREINELHVPVGRPIKLTMATQDVIHSFYIPAFRIKRDVIPGTYTSMWFTATKPGRYRLFCAEYCGTSHSGMIGWVTVMEPGDFENWLSGGASESMAQSGEKLFSQYGCASCHSNDQPGRCPPFRGVYGSTQQLTDGRRILADDAYIRESILNPQAKIVAGYQPIMPTYQGQISEEDLLRLLAYIKSIGQRPQPASEGIAEGPARGTMGATPAPREATTNPQAPTKTGRPPR